MITACKHERLGVRSDKLLGDSFAVCLDCGSMNPQAEAELMFKLERTERALETANQILAENGLLGVLVDLINPDP